MGRKEAIAVKGKEGTETRWEAKIGTRSQC